MKTIKTISLLTLLMLGLNAYAHDSAKASLPVTLISAGATSEALAIPSSIIPPFQPSSLVAIPSGIISIIAGAFSINK